MGNNSNSNQTIPTQISCTNNLSVVEIENNKPFKIYPNPTNDILNIENSNFQKIDKIIISDFTGKTILEANENTNQLNLENLEVGVYIINISSNGKSNKMKIIKK